MGSFSKSTVFNSTSTHSPTFAIMLVAFLAGFSLSLGVLVSLLFSLYLVERFSRNTHYQQEEDCELQLSSTMPVYDACSPNIESGSCSMDGQHVEASYSESSGTSEPPSPPSELLTTSEFSDTTSDSPSDTFLLKQEIAPAAFNFAVLQTEMHL